MVHVRRVLLVIALLGDLVIGACDIIVLTAINKLDFKDGIFEAVKQSMNMDYVQSAINVAQISFLILAVIMLLATIFIFADKKAKQKIIGIGWLCFMPIVFGVQAFVPNIYGLTQTTMSELKSKLAIGLISCVVLLFLVIVGLVNCEKQLKESAAQNTMLR